MLQESFDHAREDRSLRALAEQRVEAQSLLAAIGAAIDKDCDLLSAEERAAIDAAVAALDAARKGDDHRRIKAAIATLNNATEAFAARRMDRAISAALLGRNIDQVGRGRGTSR